MCNVSVGIVLQYLDNKFQIETFLKTYHEDLSFSLRDVGLDSKLSTFSEPITVDGVYDVKVPRLDVFQGRLINVGEINIRWTEKLIMDITLKIKILVITCRKDGLLISRFPFHYVRTRKMVIQ